MSSRHETQNESTAYAINESDSLKILTVILQRDVYEYN